MKVLDVFKGAVRVELSAASFESLLNSCALEAVVLWDMEFEDKYLLRASVYENQLEALELLAKKCSCELEIVKIKGGSRNRKMIGKRKWLAVFLLFAVLLLVISSFFIWKLEIYGAEGISHGRILRALDECGVRPGAFRFSFSPDLVRSRMLCLVPEIGWMSVNVNGSCAKVLVEPRQEKPEIYLESDPSYIVAGKTGIIRELFVMNGKSLVNIGQAVVEGESLVSGYMESLSNEPRAVRARADVMADTWYDISAVYPLQTELKGEEKWSYSRFSIRFLKKRINFYFSGRNDIDECDKIVHEYNLGIEGLFSFPLSIIREEIVCRKREMGGCDISEEIGRRMLEELEGAVCGEIVSSSLTASHSQGLCTVNLRAACYENIALNIDFDSAQQP